MKRRDTLALAAATTAAAAAATAWPAPGGAAPAPAAAGAKVLRLAYPVAETGFDPARVSDLYSAAINAHIFESAYGFDHLARPLKIVPRLAAGMPEHSDDYRVWTIRLQPGVTFADDPAFKGQRRELVAEDMVYSWKRFADPVNKSPYWNSVEDIGFIGLAALRDKALKDKTPFDYDTPIEGLRALDRHTVQYTLAAPRPRLLEELANTASYGTLAREVVEFYGDKIPEHPVGTGPFRLAQWRRSSRIVLERNPNYRQVLWDADPAPGDAEGLAIKQRMQGRRLPLVDRVEISIIEEAQPRWLSFLNTEADFIEVPQEFAPVAVPNARLAPNLAKRSVRHWRVLLPRTQMSFFNMEDPVVGGLEPAQVALRRALSLSQDMDKEIRLAWRGQAMPAQAIIAPNCSGYDPRFKSENSDYDPSRARALLDLYGFIDRDGDGWRERPDGSPLRIQCSTQPDQLSRQFAELMQKSFAAIGVRIEFKVAKWPENLKSARLGKLMMWRVGSTATQPDGQDVLRRLYSREAGQGNLARFRLPAFDEVFEQMTALPDGPQRDALFERAKRIAVAYAPYKAHIHQYVDVLVHPWLDGYRRPLFWYDWYHRVDVDMARRPAA